MRFLKLVVADSYIVEFDVFTYLSLYPSFLVCFLMSRSKGLEAFYKQLTAIILIRGLTSSFKYLIIVI